MFSISLQGFQKSLWHVIVSLYKVLAWTRKCYLKCGEVINQYILNWNIIVWVFLVCLPHVGRFLLAALSHRMRQMHLIAYAWSVTEMFYVCQHEISQFSSLFFCMMHMLNVDCAWSVVQLRGNEWTLFVFCLVTKLGFMSVEACTFTTTGTDLQKIPC